MACDGEGKIYIPVEEFRAFVRKYANFPSGHFVVFGVPDTNGDEGDIVIDYAFSTDTDPHEWATPPKAVQQRKDKKGS